jgi:hypothetical protein
LININAQTGVQFPAGITHVIVIGIDGMSPDGIRTASTPVMHQLIEQGAVKWNVRTVLPSISSPNWASMIMGAGTEAHGITDNDWGRQEYTLPPVVSDEEGIFPTIFGWIRKNRPDAEIGAVYQWTGFGRLFEKSAVNYDKNMPDEVTTAETFSAYIRAKKPLFAFMHLDHVDDAGHELGHGTPGYYQAVSKADSLIGIVVKSIKEAGIEKNTLLIITADHGGVGYGHGGATTEEAEVATIFSGKDVKKGYLIQQQVYTYDLAATIAFVLHIIPPYAWTGRPVKAAFSGFNEPSNLYLGKTIIPSPKIYPWKYLYQKAGGLYIDSAALVTMQPIADNAFVHYTTDGSLPVAASVLYKGPFTVDTTTVITARSFDKTGNASQPVTAYYRVVSSKEGHGLHAVFYPGNDWNHLPVLSTMTGTHEWNCYEFSLNRDQIISWLGKDTSSFGITMQGFLQIDEESKYSFYTQSDDGSKLFIDNNVVVDNDGDHGVIERTGDVQLSKGKHLIKVEYYNGQGGFWLDVLYKGPHVPKQIIPANKLFLPEQKVN